MRVLFLNQAFYPDVVSSGQHLKDFALGLVARGHKVTVVVSRRAYDNPSKTFLAREIWRGIEIYRIPSTGFGKGAKWKRAVDFGSFGLACLWRLVQVGRPDVVVAMTSPPLISFIGACYASLRRTSFVYWVMDMNPDAAIAAGWLRPSSLTGRFLERLSRFSFRRADKIISLDRFMAERIAAKGIEPAKIETLPPWSHDDMIQFDSAGRERFRREHGLDGKFVVMYSGNHSPCNPLTTLLEAARELRENPQFIFLFVGGGSELPKIGQFALENRLSNVRVLGYQPLDKLAASLSAADLHVVSLGDPYVGVIHPCKIYNILSVGAPVLYLGPSASHMSEILASLNDSTSAPRTTYSARHGNVAEVIHHLRAAAAAEVRGNAEVYRTIAARFKKDSLMPRHIKVIEELSSRSSGI